MISKDFLLIISAGLLLGIIGDLLFILTAAGFLEIQGIHFFAAAMISAVVLFVFYQASKVLYDMLRNAPLYGTATLLFLAVNLVLCFTPPIARDELNHHLAFPKLYLQEGGLVHNPSALYSYYPMLLQILYVPLLNFNLEWAPKALHFTFGLMTALLFYHHLFNSRGHRAACAGFLIFISIPIVQKSMHTAYVDLGLVYFISAALLSLALFYETKERFLVAAAGIATGFALSAKPNGLIAGLLLALILLHILVVMRLRVGEALRTLALFGVLCIAAVFPWYLKNYSLTGNPIYPQFESFFGSNRARTESVESQINLTIYEERKYRYGESDLEIFLLPLRVFLTGRDGNPREFDGALSPLLILFLPWAFSRSLSKARYLYLFYSVTSLIIILSVAMARARYLLPVVAGFIPLAAAGFDRAAEMPRVKRPVFALFWSIIALHLYYTYQTFNRLAPLAYFSGSESREAYLSRKLGYFPLTQKLNETPDSKVYLIFTGRQTYYIDHGFYFDEGEFPKLLFDSINSAASPEQIAATLSKNGITHLLIRVSLLNRYFEDNLPVDKIELWKTYVERYLYLVESRGEYALFEIKSDG